MSREGAQQAATEGLQVSRGNGDQKSEAFALYAVIRLRLLQGDSASSCQQASMEATKLLRELGEKKHAATLQLLLARSSLSPGFGLKTAAALRHAAEAFTLFDAQADKASALMVQAEAQLSAKNGAEAIATANKALPLLQGDAIREAATMILIAKAHILSKAFIQAEESATSAVGKASSDNGLLASAKAVVAESMLGRGHAKAKEAAAEALELAKGTNADVEASLLHLLAKNSLPSNPREALDYASKAMTINMLKGETKQEAAATHTAAKAHLAVKEYDSALQLSMQAAQAATSVGDTVMQASALYTASQARIGKGQTGDALLAARKSAELFHSIGDKEGEKTVASAINKIQDKMPPPHRPTNVLNIPNQMGSPTNLMNQVKHCVVWNTPCKEGAYTSYTLELLRLVDDISKSSTPQIPLIICSMGTMGRHLACPVPGQQKDVHSMSVWGVIRTVRLEMPRLPICAVDLPTDADGAEMARVICDATADAGPRMEVAYSKVEGDGAKLLEKLGRGTGF